MKITAVRIRRLTGTMATDGPMWEDRLVRPIDIYPDYRKQGPWEGGVQADDKHLRLTQDFLEIDTDVGITGRAGPVWPDCSHLILTHFSTSSWARTRSPTSCCGTRCTGSRCTAARGSP